MGTEDDTKEVELLEEMFKDRFTERDAVYMEIKSKSLSHPTVIHPWKLKRQWNKNWDYSAERRDHDRNRSRYGDRNHHRDHRGNSSSNYRDRSYDGESSRHRDRSYDGESSRHRDRSYDNRHRGGHSDHRNSSRRRDDRR